MGKPFKTIDEQVNLLKKRKIIIGDEKLVKKQLLTTTYYNTVNSYGYFLRDSDGSGNFIDGSTFKELFHLYSFDKELKNTLFRFVVTIESVFKSIISYQFSMDYQGAFSYLKCANYKDGAKELRNNKKFTDRLYKIITDNRYSEPFGHYCSKHQNIPLWILIKKLDFGTTCFMYERMKKQNRDKIANILSENAINNHSNDYSLTSKQVDNYMNIIKKIRNMVAHNERLLNYKTGESIQYHKVLHPEYGRSKQDERITLYDVLIIMKLFLTNDQYINLNNSIKKRIRKLEKELNSISIQIITESLGLPKDWQKTTFTNK